MCSGEKKKKKKKREEEEETGVIAFLLRVKIRRRLQTKLKLQEIKMDCVIGC